MNAILDSFDDITAAGFTTPPLTTLRHPHGAIGRELVDQLLTTIDEPGHRGEVLLRPELVVRGTTAPPPTP